jgi:environmental stress-induced protein Ves
VPAAFKIIRKSSFAAQPWKNGGGITHEAMRVPAGGDSFLWRVSVAHIDSSGPFSDFAGYRRNMVLLRGRGLMLKFGNGNGNGNGDGNARALRKIGDFVEFDGAVPIYCELFDGPCVDLNFMVSKALKADARILLLDTSVTLPATLGCTLIFGVEVPLLLDIDAGEPVTLEPWDLAVVSQGTARLRRIETDHLSVPSAVFFATISH